MQEEVKRHVVITSGFSMPAFSVKQDLSWEEALMALNLDESCDVKTSVDWSFFDLYTYCYSNEIYVCVCIWVCVCIRICEYIQQYDYAILVIYSCLQSCMHWVLKGSNERTKEHKRNVKWRRMSQCTKHWRRWQK